MLLNLPTTIADGDNRSAVVLRDLIHDKANPEDSLNIINGLLDYENVDSTWAVSKEYTQRGSAIDMLSAARTVNLDWSWRVFADYATTTSYKDGSYGGSVVDSGLARPIPGGCREFYSKWDGYALVTWTIFWASDNGARGEDKDDLTSILLVANGTYQDSQLRHTGQCVDGSSTYFYQRARVWSGHAIVEITEGFNSVGLHIIGDYHVRLTRTWACNIQVVPFKYPGG